MPAHPNTPWLALSVRYLALVFLVGAVLTSCNRKGDSAQQQTTQRERTTLRLPLDSDVPTMDPIHITDVRSASVARQIFSTLVRYDKDLKLVPDIAERWEVASDKLTLRFYLTKGAKFQNGREVTAEDFVYSLTRLADTKEVSERATLMRDVVGYSDFRSGKAVNLAGLSAPDPYTLQIKLSKPYSPFLATLAMINFAVVPREVIEAAPKDQPGYWAHHPVGSGPFTMQEWKTDTYTLLKAFPDYFLGKPKLDSILYKVIPDMTTQLNAYENGEIDATNIPVGSLRRIMDDPNYKSQFHRKDLLAIQFYVLNMEKDPWMGRMFGTQKQLRQALNYAINREYISQEILEGRLKPFVGIIPPAMTEWYNPANKVEPRYNYDVDKARALLEASGHPQGMYIPSMPMYYNNFSFYPQVAMQMNDFLRDISVKVEPQALEFSTFLDTMRRGDYFIGRCGWVADYPDPDTFLWQLLASENAGWQDNWARYKNPNFDALVEQARVEVDKEKRKLLYWQAEQIAIDDAPWIFLFAQTSNVLIKPGVQGLELSGMDVDASFPNNDMSKVRIMENVTK
jgi:oligopeptide transport system substrate-binding protein